MEDGCTSIDDQRDCQSNHKYLDASLFIDNKNGISANIVLFAFQTVVVRRIVHFSTERYC